ncbi:response regulator [Bariatricus massiliensis]|uniref:Stage 0 sporulation protein A homolog n=1 Tax=Bariatricus massiliensis TaxID=1745713 RepID=A0ABS8DG11_9FIRM|nr:response regulator [Bariatricus massiliensis]MCB7304236.1 response regulator [Bariatricus massiliensis]MCB7374887.1 response regulator [Bariatricus massiliensis]MCB7387346.1 response regulator [Bariatricus massiliensis]MCB7411508.1 response regulator [Bariatricus massiliensis]MCQ5253643.1 response regulator [Bariatricus massiliensis]
MQERKWKILIVDDEFRIGQLIKRLIKWDELPLICTDVVDNGETAYQVILDERPDIVITDIRMPKINGLDLVCMTKEIAKDIRFIIISGYKEFEYAHRALQYGVNDYLLKPISETELNEVLQKLTGELSRDCAAVKAEREMRRTVSVSEHIIRRDLLSHIMDKEQIPSQTEMEQAYHVVLDAALYRGIDIKLDYTDFEKSDKKQDRLTMEKVLAIVEQNLDGHAKEELICEKPGMHLYCLFNYEAEKSKEIKGVIGAILSDIQDYLMGFEQYVVTIGVGTEKNEFAQMRYSIEEAQVAAGNRIKLGTGRLIYAEILRCETEKEIEDYLKPHKAKLKQAVETYSREGLEQSVNQIYSPFMLKEDLDFSLCYPLAEEIISYFFEHVEVQSRESDDLKEFLFASVNQCYSITKLKELLKQNLGDYLTMSLKILETESTRPIRQAKQYVDDNYAEKITLEDIAGIVELNPVYFSVLFKKETGMNFSAYLVNIRMEMAKKMLREGNETIAAVAEKVGYKDSRYFSQIFSKTVGVKPALYRKLHS